MDNEIVDFWGNILLKLFQPDPPNWPKQTKNKEHKGKRKVAIYGNSKQRRVTLSRRKGTLFRNAVKLHLMNKAEVLQMVEPTKEHHILWGSPRLIAEYEKGNLWPIVDQETFESGEMEEVCDGGDHVITVQALADTPQQIHWTKSPTLARVLGHSPNVNQRSPSVRTCIPFENTLDTGFWHYFAWSVTFRTKTLQKEYHIFQVKFDGNVLRLHEVFPAF